jgi:hypothetical protein
MGLRSLGDTVMRRSKRGSTVLSRLEGPDGSGRGEPNVSSSEPDENGPADEGPDVGTSLADGAERGEARAGRELQC